MIETTEHFIERLARYTAIAGGVVLVAVAIMAGISITGRAFLWAGLKPVPGDFELVETGMAFTISAFMPWTQLKKGHATVTILTDLFSDRVNAVIELISDLLLFGVAVLLSWRLIFGMIDKFKYGETTFILQFPLWWAYAAALVGLLVWIVVAAWCVAASAAALSHGTTRGSAGRAVH